jgi:hypothetical protein
MNKKQIEKIVKSLQDPAKAKEAERRRDIFAMLKDMEPDTRDMLRKVDKLLRPLAMRAMKQRVHDGPGLHELCKSIREEAIEAHFDARQLRRGKKKRND